MKTATQSINHFGALRFFRHGMLPVLAALLLLGGRAMATTYYSYGNADPTVLTSWWSANNGTGSNPANFTSGDTFIVQSGSSYASTVGWTVSGNAAIQVNGALTISNTYTFTGTTLTLNSGGYITNSGVMTGGTNIFNAGATYVHNQNGGTIPTATWSPASTLTVIGVSTTVPTVTSFKQALGNVIWNCPNQTAALSMAGDMNNVQNLTVISTGSSVLRYALSGFPSTFMTNHGSLNILGGKFGVYGSTSGTVTFYLYGNLVVSGSGMLWGESGTTNCDIVFVGSGVQTFTGGGVFASNVNYTVASGSTLDFGTYTLGGGAGTFANNGTLITANPSGFAGSIGLAGAKTLGTGGSYVYDGTTAQSGDTLLPATVGGLKINGAGGLTLAATETVTNLTLSTGLITGNVVIASGGTVMGGGAASYVNGTLQEPLLAGMTAATFPIGDTSTFAGVSLTNMSVTSPGTLAFGTTAGQYPQIDTAAINSSQDLARYWTTTVGGSLAVSTYDITLNFSPGDLFGGASPASFIMGQYVAGTGWTYPAVSAAAATSTTASGVTTGFGDFVLGNQAVSGISHFVVTPSVGSTTADAVFTATVQAYNTSDQAITNSSVDGTSVTLTSSGLAQFDSNGDGVYGDITKALTNGTFTINVRDPKAESITLTALSGTNSGTSSTVLILPAAAAQLQVLLPGETAAPGTASGKSGTPLVQTAGTPFVVTVNEVDANWNLVASSDTVHLAATGDANIALPANTALGGGTVNLSVTDILSGGVKTISASDVSNGGISSGTSAGYSVVPGTVARMLLLAPGETPTFGLAPGKSGTAASQYPTVGYTVTVDALDAYYNLVTNASDLVALTSSDIAATLPVSASLIGGTAALHLTNDMVGSVTLTATNVTKGSAVATGSSAISLLAISTTTTLAASANPANAGQSVTFAATIGGVGIHTGTVTFKADGAILGTASVSGTSAAFTTSGGVGTNVLTAAYSGDANNYASTSAPLTEVIETGVVANPAQMQDGFDYPLIGASPGMPIGNPVPGLGVWECSSDISGNTAVTGNALIIAGDITSLTTPPLQPLPNQTNPPAHLWINKGATDREMLRSIGNAISSGSVYFSFLMSNSVAPSTAGAPMVTMLASNVNNGPYGYDPVTLYGRTGGDSTHYNLGIQRLSGPISWAAATLAQGTPYIIVLEYTFGGNDQLFINPVPGAAQPPADAVAVGGTNAEPANIGTVLFYEAGSTYTIPSDGTWNYDVLRADASWYNVTPPLGASGLGAAALAFSPAAQIFTVNSNSALITVTLLDQSNDVYTAEYDTVVSLSSSSGLGTFLSAADGTTAITNVTIAAGTSTASFYYKDGAAGSPTLTGSSGLLSPATQVELVNPPAGTVDHFTVTPSTTSVHAGAAFIATVQAYDSNNVAIANSSLNGVVVTMHSSGLAQFDSDNDGIYDDNTEALTNGAFTIAVRDLKAETMTITAELGTLTGSSSPVTITPDSAAMLQVLLPGETAAPGTPSGKTGTPADVTSGTGFSVVINAVDTNWNVAASTDVVQLTASNDGNAVLPGSITLVGGTVTVAVTNILAGSARSLTATDASNGAITANTSSAYNVVPGAATQLLVLAPGETATFGVAPGKTGTPSPQIETGSYNLTVYALDASYNWASNNSDTIQLASTDGTATLPPGAGLAGGVKTFTVVNNTGGTVTDTATDLTSGSVAPGSTTLSIGVIPRYETIASGNWNVVTNWLYSTDDGNTWTPAATTPNSAVTALAIITNGDTITVSSSLAISRTTVAAGATVVVPSGVTLSVIDNPGYDLNVYGALNNAGVITNLGAATTKMNNGSIYYHNEDGGSILTATWDTNATCDVTGWTTTTTVTAATGLKQAFGNFTWNSPGQSATLSMGGSPLSTINGNFTVLGTGSGVLAICLAATVNLSIGGDLNIAGGTVYGATTGSGNETVNIAGNLYLSSGTLDIEADATGSEVVDWNLSGNLYMSGGTLTSLMTGAPAPVLNFVKAGTQTLSVTGGTIPAASTLAWSVSSNSIVNLGNSVLNGTGTFTLAAGGGLVTTSPAGFAGNLTEAAAKLSLSPAGNYTYAGLSAQSGDTVLPATVGGLTINNPSGVVLSQAETVANLNLNNSLLTGSVTMDGTGAFTVTGANAAVSGNVTMNSSALVLVSSNNFPELTIANGTLALGGGVLQLTDLGAPMPQGNYLLVNAGAAGSVTGSAPAGATVTGLLAGLTGTPQILNGSLYLGVVAFFPGYDAGAGFFGGENLILTNASGLNIYAWSAANPATPVSAWNAEGALQEQALGGGLSRYSININPYASPTYYVLGTTNGGPFLVSPVPVLTITTPDYSTFTVTGSLDSINAAGVINLVPAPGFTSAGAYTPGAGFQLQLSGAAGQGYSILASSNLVTWTVVGTGTFGAAPASFTDTNAASLPLRFYRISVP